MSAVTRLGLALVALWVAWTPVVTGAQSPARIISLVPAVTEMLFAIGAGDRVVGVSSYDRFPAEATTRTKVGALVDPDFERILSLRPDLVIVYGTQDDLMARLARANVPVFRYVHAGLADVTQTVRAIGERVGRGDAAAALAGRIARDLDTVRARVAGRPRPRTALLFGREAGALRAMFASAGVGFMHDLLEVAGGADVFADVKRQSLQVSSEQLLARRPEVIIEVHPADGWTPQRIVSELAVWKSLAGVPAVRANRVHILADDRIAVPGPRVGEVAVMFAECTPSGNAAMKVLLSWSSGKDSAWALHVLRSEQRVNVAGLLTTFNEAVDRVAMHAVRHSLVQQQADAAGLPLIAVPIPSPCPNDVYEARMRAAVETALADGFTHVAFGDLFLEDVRRYREERLQGTGLEPLFPLWDRPTAGLAREMLSDGVQAVLTCVDPRVVDRRFVGRQFDAALLDELPDSVDPCGERGEFHTFCYAGPMFAHDLSVRTGEIVERDGFIFCDVIDHAL